MELEVLLYAANGDILQRMGISPLEWGLRNGLSRADSADQRYKKVSEDAHH